MAFSNNAADWRVADRRVGDDLGHIFPISDRAQSLLARNMSAPSLAVGFVNVSGAIEMMAGLDYHHQSFLQVMEAKAKTSSLAGAEERHEVVAYINRAGQFYYFARSEFVTALVPDAPTMIPSVVRLKPFRMKHAAHRSLDAPKGDHDAIRLMQATSLAGFGSSWSPRPGRTLPIPKTGESIDSLRRSFFASGYLTFQIPSGDDWVHFNLEVDHDPVMSECYSLIEAVIRSKLSP